MPHLYLHLQSWTLDPQVNVHRHNRKHDSNFPKDINNEIQHYQKAFPLQIMVMPLKSRGVRIVEAILHNYPTLCPETGDATLCRLNPNNLARIRSESRYATVICCKQITC